MDSGHTQRQPFFVTGLGRSGSTWLYRLLDAHPRIAITNEGMVADLLHFCLELADVPQRRPATLQLLQPVTLRGVLRDDCKADFKAVFVAHARAMLEEFYERHFADRAFTHWGDKLPGTAAALATQELYDDVRLIVLVRDPRDVSASLATFGADANRRDSDFVREGGIEHWAASWQNNYHALLEYGRRTHVCRYEDLVADPVGELDRILAFLDLDGAADCVHALDGIDTFSGHATAESVADSVGRWRTVLRPAEVAEIERTCAEGMRRFDYEPS